METNIKKNTLYPEYELNVKTTASGLMAIRNALHDHREKSPDANEAYHSINDSLSSLPNDEFFNESSLKPLTSTE